MSEKQPIWALPFEEAVAVENYKNASKEALASANSVGDKIVAAAFSLATAYGAVITLVAPKETPSAVLVAAPIVLLAAAAILALISQAVPFDISGTNEVARLREAINGVIETKRRWYWIALALLFLGVVSGGVIAYDQYSKPASDDSAVAVQVWLTPAGVAFANQACGGGVKAMVAGTVDDADDLSAERVGIEVAKTSCVAGPSTLYLDQDLIAGVRGPAAPA